MRDKAEELRNKHGKVLTVVLVINAILFIVEAVAGLLAHSTGEMDLGQLIQNSIENYLPLVRDRRIRLVGAVPAAFPSIKADPRRINQVLSNLLSNAAKFTGDTGQIEVGADQMNDGTHVRVWVKDTGVGIASEEIDSLFVALRISKEPIGCLKPGTHRCGGDVSGIPRQTWRIPPTRLVSLHALPLKEKS